MPHASSTEPASNNAWNGVGLIGRIGVEEAAVSVEIIVGAPALHSLHTGRHLLVARSCLVGIELGAVLLIGDIAGGTDNLVAEGLDHAAILTREGALGIGGHIAALLRDEHGVLAVAEVVALDESVALIGSSHTILRVSVEIVVVDMHAHGADARMARVAMVKPVVVVGNPVGTRLALHTAQRGFSTVPQVVVADSDIARVSLDVDGSIALFLVGVAAGLSVEHVKVVHPDVLIVGIDADGIVHAEHVGEVAQLNAGRIADEEAEACGDSIVANALDGDIEGRIGTLSFYLNAFGRTEELIAVGSCYSAYDADGQRTGLKTFLIAVDNVLQAGEGLGGALAVLDNVECDGLGIILGDVYDTCVALERTVVVVGTHTLGPALMGKARTVVGLDTDGCSLVGSGSHLCPIGIYGHYLECIVGGLDQSHHIGPSIGAVVAHQLGIDKRIVGVVAALHIDMIGLGSIEGGELHIR